MHPLQKEDVCFIPSERSFGHFCRHGQVSDQFLQGHSGRDPSFALGAGPAADEVAIAGGTHFHGERYVATIAGPVQPVDVVHFISFL